MMPLDGRTPEAGAHASTGRPAPGRSIFAKGLLLVALPVAFQLVTAAVLITSHSAADRADALAERSGAVLDGTQTIARQTLQGHSAIRAIRVFRDSDVEREPLAGLDDLPRRIEQLRALVVDDDQRGRVDVIASAATTYLDWARQQVRLAEARQWDEFDAALLSGAGKRRVDALMAEIATFEQTQRRVDGERVRTAVAARHATRRWLILFTLGLLPLAVIVVWQFSDRISRRIAIVARNAIRLGEGTPLAAPLTGGDEIARLDGALHETAERLADARAREQRDAGELESRAAALAEANRNLEFKTKENETFVYSASHDLRSPLVNLQGFTQEIAHGCDALRRLVRAADIPPALRREIDDVVEQDIVGSLRFIQVAVMRLSAIIDALLRLSRAGRVQYARVPVDLDAVVSRIVAALRDTMERKGATVQVHPMTQVLGDPTAIEQVLGNLLANAVAYLDPQRPGRIEVGLADGCEDGMVTVFVRDNGLGIPEGHQSKLFVPFQRLHASAAEGEGIGLALVRQIVERLGGRVWASSAEGAGSTFSVCLPAVDVPAPADAAADPAEVY